MDLNTTPPTSEMPVVGRPILDANIGMTNRVEHDDICDILINTFEDMATVLSDHCGPYGQFAMITTPNNRVAEPIFTKDGINIVRAMEYMSPMEEFARTTLAYIGSRIETAAGDGTTSSMIICARGLVTLLKHLKESPYTYSYTELINTYKDFANEVVELLNENKHTVDKYSDKGKTRKEIIKRVAFHQAYTSSHGNKELSMAVAELFANTPEEAWNYMYIDKCKYETDKTYQVEFDNTQYTIQNVRPWPTGALTEDLGTKRIRENTTILLAGIAPSSGFMEGQELLNAVKYAVENGEDLTVICPNNMDNAAMNELSDLFDKNPNHKVAFFFTNDPDPRLNDITCIKALCNKFDIVSEHTVDYVFEGGDLKITKGLYEASEDKLNPMIGNPEYKQLNLLLDNLDKIINQIKSEVSNRSNNTEVARLQKFRMKLMVSKRAYFLIGGSAYDNAAATDVVVDAILATKHSLTKGFTLGGNRTLHNALNTICLRYTARWSTPAAKKRAALMCAYAELFRLGIEAVHVANLKWFSGLPEYITKLNDKYSLDITAIDNRDLPDNPRSTCVESCMVSVDYALTGNWCDDDMSTFRGPALIIQPVSADIELVKRFGELALKFVRTQRIITPGGVCTLSKKEESTTTNPL